MSEANTKVTWWALVSIVSAFVVLFGVALKIQSWDDETLEKCTQQVNIEANNTARLYATDRSVSALEAKLDVMTSRLEDLDSSIRELQKQLTKGRLR